jgi:superfamily II DNA/RNA helicase
LHDPLFFALQKPTTETVKKKYQIPESLTEHMLVCRGDEKPLALLQLLEKLEKGSQALCFTASLRAAHRLYRLLELYGGKCVVAEFSSNFSQQARTKVIDLFRKGQVQVLVCSDALARGMDIEEVQTVINYDTPVYIKTYVHRVGRTARAGRDGHAMTLLVRKEVRHFKQMLTKAQGSAVQQQSSDRTATGWGLMVPRYRACLQMLPKILAREQQGELRQTRALPSAVLAAARVEIATAEAELQRLVSPLLSLPPLLPHSYSPIPAFLISLAFPQLQTSILHSFLPLRTFLNLTSRPGRGGGDGEGGGEFQRWV